MFLAFRDLAYAKGRFLLMGTVVALVAFLMTFLSGLSGGLIQNNISGLMKLDATHIAFEYDDKPTYGNTMIERDQWEDWASRSGVLAMEPMGHTIFNARTESDDPLAFVMWGVRPGSFVEPPALEGEQLGRLPNGVIISRQLADKDGVRIGDRFTLDRVLTEFEVVGITDERNIGHMPIVFAPLRIWQEATYGPPGGPPPGEKLPDILYDFVSVLVLQLDASMTPEKIAAIDDEVGTKTLARQQFYEASIGYQEEVVTVTLIQGFLIAISAVVIGAFFSIWTIQRTREIGLVKALGASNAYLLRDAMGQMMLLMGAGILIGASLGLWLGRSLAVGGNPFMFEPQKLVTSMALLLLAGLIGGALSIHRITSVDPIIALGQEQ